MQQQPSKVRRFIWRFVKITVITLVLLLVTLYSLLQLHSVQTWLGRQISHKLSKDLHTAIAINAVRINFFKTAHLEGVYVEDLHHDTLLYGNQLSCDIAFLSFTKKGLSWILRTSATLRSSFRNTKVRRISTFSS